MKASIKNMPFLKALYWLPRIITVVYILFMGLFALDVFHEGSSIWEMAVGFIIHLMPNYILTACLFVAWKWERIGGLLFIFLGLLMFWFFGNPIQINLFLFGPLFVVGFLFITHNYILKQRAS